MPFDTSGAGPGGYQPPETPSTVPQHDPPVIPRGDLPPIIDGEEYVVLMKLTQTGAEQADALEARFGEFSAAVTDLGGFVEFYYSTLGPYDLAGGVTLPDDASAFSLAATLSTQGYVSPLTMKAVRLWPAIAPHNHPH
jgi:uncharacterized protein with GYD domain